MEVCGTNSSTPPGAAERHTAPPPPISLRQLHVLPITTLDYMHPQGVQGVTAIRWPLRRSASELGLLVHLYW